MADRLRFLVETRKLLSLGPPRGLAKLPGCAAMGKAREAASRYPAARRSMAPAVDQRAHGDAHVRIQLKQCDVGSVGGIEAAWEAEGVHLASTTEAGTGRRVTAPMPMPTESARITAEHR
jgi:hypothetical protein